MLVLSYKAAGSVHMGGQCRFEPSCSDYALAALEQHSPLRAFTLIAGRIFRCRPFGPYGPDPVPHGEPHANT